MVRCESPELHALLDSIEDTRDVVVRRYDVDDVAQAVWKAARDEARDAWRAWSRRPDRDAWVVYVAARDREDAAFTAFEDVGVGSAGA